MSLSDKQMFLLSRCEHELQRQCADKTSLSGVSAPHALKMNYAQVKFEHRSAAVILVSVACVAFLRGIGFPKDTLC